MASGSLTSGGLAAPDQTATSELTPQQIGVMGEYCLFVSAEILAVLRPMCHYGNFWNKVQDGGLCYILAPFCGNVARNLTLELLLKLLLEFSRILNN